jgi:hypothetical protein
MSPESASDVETIARSESTRGTDERPTQKSSGAPHFQRAIRSQVGERPLRPSEGGSWAKEATYLHECCFGAMGGAILKHGVEIDMGAKQVSEEMDPVGALTHDRSRVFELDALNACQRAIGRGMSGDIGEVEVNGHSNRSKA